MDSVNKYRRLPWALWSLAILASLASLVLRVWNLGALASHVSGAEWLMEILYWVVLIPLSVPAFSTAGVLIATRMPKNQVGWLCLGLGLLIGVQDTAWQYAARVLDISPEQYPAGAWLLWLISLLTSLQLPPLPFTLLLLRFPDGQLSSPRWRYIEWAVLLTTGVRVVLVALAPTYSTLSGVEYGNPFEIASPGWIILLSNRIIVPVSYGLLIIALIGPFFRWRKAGPTRRLQIKWLMFVCAAILALSMCALLVTLVVPDADYVFVILGAFAIAGVSLGIPAAIGIAVLKHRLYNIDLIISLTLFYTLLTLSVSGIYILAVGYMSELLRTSNSLIISLVATGIVAVLFQPLREALQRRVNRLIYGDRNDPYQVLHNLSRRLENTIAPQMVLPTIVETVAHSLKLPYVAIELFGSGERLYTAAVHPSDGVTAAPPKAVRFPLNWQHEHLGFLILAPRSSEDHFSSSEERLLEAITRQAGVAVRAVRLTSELQRSRERIVNLREDERRRIWHDLHDGLGPQMAGINLQAGNLKAMIRHDPVAAEAAVVELRHEVQNAISDIRRLVYDLRLPSLDELGIMGAIRRYVALTDKTGLFFHIDAPELLPALAPAVEVATYRIVQEAITNIIRHANAKNIQLRIKLMDSDIQQSSRMLEIEIRDDGIGFGDSVVSGNGITSMRERAEELGGMCYIGPAEVQGTRVLARIPVYDPPLA